MEALTNELTQVFFAVVQQKRCFAKIQGNAKNDCLLPRQNYRYVEAWLYITNLANICLHKSTDAKFYPFTEEDKDLLENIQEDVVGGPSVIFTRKAVVDEISIPKSTTICKSIVGIDASQLYPY